MNADRAARAKFLTSHESRGFQKLRCPSQWPGYLAQVTDLTGPAGAALITSGDSPLPAVRPTCQTA
jgi:hypothetical protein